MDTRQIEAKTKGFTKPGDLDDGTILKILDEGKLDTIHTRDGKDKTVFKLGVKVGDGDATTVTINSTSMADIVSEFGTETKQWVGRELEVYHVQQVAFGKVAKVGLLRPQGSKPQEKKKAK